MFAARLGISLYCDLVFDRGCNTKQLSMQSDLLEPGQIPGRGSTATRPGLRLFGTLFILFRFKVAVWT